MIADPALMCQASAAIFRKRLVQSLPRRVKTLTAACISEMDLDAVAVELDLMNPGYGALMPIAAGFLRCNAILNSLCKRTRTQADSRGIRSARRFFPVKI